MSSKIHYHQKSTNRVIKKDNNNSHVRAAKRHMSVMNIPTDMLFPR